MAQATCSVPGCVEPIRNKTRQLCNMHYQRWWKTGDVGQAAPVRRPVRSDGNKQCSACNEILPASCFTKDKTHSLGLAGRCKTCVREYQARYLAENRDAISERRKRKYAASPELRAANRERFERWKISNREIYLAYQRSQYEKDKPAYKARAREWGRAHPEWGYEQARRYKALKKSRTVGRITPKLLAAKCAYWGWRCWLCGGEMIELDHVKPLAKGGLHALANIRPACRSCNAAKADRWPYPVTGGPAWRVAA